MALVANWTPDVINESLALITEFFKKHNVSCGESITQSDNPTIEAPELLAEIADRVMINIDEDGLPRLHDIVLEVAGEDFNTNQLIEVYCNLPLNLRKDVDHWGMDDTVVRDNIFEFLQSKLRK